ncbi:MAG: hypothetical protein GC152_00045 [Alphaproteobacteria bacterium]|nr:hypothetical protein [Alphaproteobacteria bacterium]
MTPSIRAGAIYFAAVFSLGFALGTVRVLFLVPRYGETASTVLELPAMLVASWFICGSILARFPTVRGRGARLMMGAAAFALLMLAELILATTLFGRPPGEHLARYGTLAGAVGLAGQICFALMPLVARR